MLADLDVDQKSCDDSIVMSVTCNGHTTQIQPQSHILSNSSKHRVSWDIMVHININSEEINERDIKLQKFQEDVK